MKRSTERTLVQQQPNPSAIPAPLRYYDPELQNAWNVEPCDHQRIERAMQKGKELHAAYLKQVAKLAPRLSKQTLSRFADPNQPLFDADLLAFSFGDAIPLQKRQKRLETTVQATFRDFSEQSLHLLTYKNVLALNVNAPAVRWFESGTHYRIDSLLADELTAVDAHFMQHAFLFASGASISIQFQKVTWKKQNL